MYLTNYKTVLCHEFWTYGYILVAGDNPCCDMHLCRPKEVQVCCDYSPTSTSVFFGEFVERGKQSLEVGTTVLLSAGVRACNLSPGQSI
jgi:hypothetical protein